MPIHTVLGSIAPEQLGPTSMHEHVLSDVSIWTKPRREEPPAGVEMGPKLRSYLAWNALALKENLILDDPEVAVEELTYVPAAGGSAVVDLTVRGLGPQWDALPEISRRSGVTICVGAGYYVGETHPADVLAADEDALTALLVRDLTEGMGEKRIMPALLGEIGTSYPLKPEERRMLIACGRAAVLTGSAVSVHTSFRGMGGVEVLEILLATGMSADRIIIGHLDELFDKAYHREIAQAGAVLAYDTFGNDYVYGHRTFRAPTDPERLDMVEWLLSEGFGGQLVIAADVWLQATLRRNGGNGYDHLFARIVPAIDQIAGDDGATVRSIMIDNPRRLLDRP